MRILILNDGTRRETFRCGAAEGVLWIGLTGETDMASVCVVFGDPQKTARMTDTYDSEGAHTVVHEGYTELFYLQITKEGMLIALKKGA